MSVANSTSLKGLLSFIRSITENGGIISGIKNSRELNRKCVETSAVNSEAKRSQGFYRWVNDNLTGNDNVLFPVLFLRTVTETQGVTDTVKKWGTYIRGLYVEAGSMAGTVRWGEFYRTESDIVQAKGSVLRSLFIFVRLVTTSLVRDFILRRFLIAREELVLKSSITRELNLDSKIS
jgi:hypothetical protein